MVLFVRVALVTLMCVLAPRALAQPPPNNSGTASPVGNSPVVLFLSSSNSGVTDQDALREALQAQFALIEARLVFAEGFDADRRMSQRIRAARAAGAEANALAVFWIETESERQWLLHMMDIESTRLLIRPVEVTQTQESAAVEAVAVMVRESTQALLESPPPPAQRSAPPVASPVPTPAAAPSSPRPPAAPADRAGPLEIWVGYAGSDFAPQTAFQHGVGAGALLALDSARVAYVGLSAALWPATEVAWAERLEFRFDVTRVPVTLLAGYRLRDGLFSFTAGFGLTADFVRRHPARVVERPPEFAVETESGGSWALMWALSPRLRAQIAFASGTGPSLYAAAGANLLLQDFQYFLTTFQQPAERTILQAHRLQPVFEVGVALQL